MLQICKQLFEKWNSKVRYCHWKSNEHLCEGLDGITDLDVLLSIDDKQVGCSILEELKFVYCDSQYGSRYPNVEDWIGFDYETCTQIHLHLHFQIVTGHKGMKEYNLPWNSQALQTRIIDPITGVYIMEPNLEIVTLYTRIGLKANPKKIISARKGLYDAGRDNKKEIDYLKKRIDWDKVYSIANTYYGSFANEFIEILKHDIISSSDFLTLKTLAEKSLQSACRYNRVTTKLVKYYYTVAFRLRKMYKRFIDDAIIVRKTPKNANSLSIAFVGQDGSGKSTITVDIEKWLSWKLDARRFYLGSGEHYISLSTKIKRILRGQHPTKAKTRSIQPSSKTNNKPKKKTFLGMINGSYIFYDISKRALNVVMQARKFSTRGGIVLFDRFPQNQFFGIYDGPKIKSTYIDQGRSNWFVRLMAKQEEKCIAHIQNYQPSLVFKLVLSPEESIRRKPFENYENVKAKSVITKELVFEHSEIHEIDATMPYEDELKIIKRIIWKHIITQNQQSCRE